MALISAKDYLSKNGSPSVDSSGTTASDGFISADAFKKDKQDKQITQNRIDNVENRQKFGPVIQNLADSPFIQKLNNDQSALENSYKDYAKTSSPFAPSLQDVIPKWQNEPAKTSYPGGIINPLNDLGHLSNFLSPFTNAAGHSMGVPDNMMRSSQSTGNKIVDKVQGFLGGTAGYLTNPSQLENSIGNNFFGNSLVQGAANKIGGSLERILPNNVATNLLSKTAQGAAIGGLGSAAYAPFNTLMTGGDLQDIPNNVLDQGVSGAVFGGALGGIGETLSKSFNMLFKKGIPAESASLEQTQPVLGLPEPKSAIMAREAQNRSVLEPNTDPIYGQGDIHTFGLPEGNYTPPTRLRVNSPNESLDYVMTKIKPEVMNIIEAPTRRDLLVQYVQKNTQIPVDEIHNMPIETLKSVGQDIQDSLHKNMQQIAFDVAKQHGHDLPALLEGQAPSLRAQLAKDTQSQVYGVPAPRVGIQKPNFNVIHNADAAMPETKIKRTADLIKPDVGSTRKTKIIKPDVPVPIKEKPITAPVNDVIQTKEPRVRDKIINFLDEAEQAARDRLKAKRNTLSSNPIDQYADYAIIGASKIAKGAIKFSEWSSHMVQEFGEDIKPHLKAIFDRSKSNVKDAERQASGVSHLPGVNSGIDPLKGDKVDIMSLDGAIENSGAWKDKNRLLLNRETTERNFEDVMGKDAPIMKKTYTEPIQKSAADRQRFITQERSDIKDLGIKYKSPEDALVQKYGEGKMSELELQAASPKNWQKIKAAAKTMRSKYDTYLNTANEVLKRNGYPEIPKRKNYFPHYEEIDGLMSKLGFGFEDNTLPADLNGITANLKPGKNFFTHALRRKGDDTTLGAMAGHDRYIEGISKIIHQTDNIKRLRGLDKTLRETHEGTTHLSDFLGNLTDYTNILAGKKTEMDRSLEAFTGRNLYSAVDWLKRRVGANMVGGSVSSALTNTIPVTQLLAGTSKTSVLKGLASALQNIKGNDVIGQESNFLNRRFTSDKLAMGKLDKVQKVAGALFKGIDHFTSNVVMRSKYYENIKKGMPESDALHVADQYATKMMADRSEGSMPTMFHSRTFGLVTQFQLEVNNQLSHLFKDMPKSMSKAKYASAITQVLVYDYLYNQVYEKITGNRPAFDPMGIAVQAIQDYSNPRLSKGKANGNLVQNIANNLPFASVATGGRIPLGAAMPNVFGANGLIKGNAKLGDELLKPLKYLALPFGGSQINKTITGLSAVNQGGVHGTDSQGKDILKYPIEKSPANFTKGALFGKSALPETNQFYQNNTPALTANETRMLQKHNNDPKMYSKIMIQKQMNTLDDKYSKIDNDPNLSREQKKSQIGQIKNQMRELKAKMKAV